MLSQFAARELFSFDSLMRTADGKGRKKVRRRNVRGKVNEIQREKFREKGAEQRARAGDKAEFAGDLTVHSRP